MEETTMKKVFGIAALLLALAACNKVETEFTPVEQVEQPSDSKGITITATLAPKTADTKAVADNGDNKITVTWAENEHIAILYDKDGAQVADATITAVNGTTGAATISFTVVSGTADNTACTLVYPYSAAKDDKSGVKDAATLLSAQDGTLNANLDVRVGAGTIQTTTPGLDVTTQPAAQFAIFKFTVKNADASATIDVKPLIVTIGTQDYTVTPASATSELYVALPAVSGQTVSFSATGSDSKTYTCAKDGVTFAAAKYYQSTLKMAAYKLLSAATAEDKGKIVGQDGNIYDTKDAAEAAGTQAVAMIAYVGNGEGLALALTNEGSMTWSTAKSTCEGKTAVSGAAWMLPSQEQWKAMFKANGGNEAKCDGLNAALATAGDELTKTASYWSSTPYDGNRAWLVRLVDAIWSYDDMDYSFRVRACLSFTATRVLAEATAEDKGKVVCAAGHLHTAKTAVPAGCTAVGILGKVTETGHGLILALQDATAQTWNTINGWTTVTAYAGTTLKQLPAGALGSLTSYTTLGSTAVSNWCVAQKSDYKAIFVNLGSTTGDSEGKTYDGNVNAYITTGVGGAALDGSYWSATEGDYTIAWYFASIYWYYSNKKYSSSVRPVLAF